MGLHVTVWELVESIKRLVVQMKITIRPLELDSDQYSREYGVERSMGCHLMAVVERILERRPELQGGKKIDREKYYDGEPTTEALRTAGFVWERAMSENFNKLHPDAQLSFPGEMLWCMNCDDVLFGGRIGREHCRTRKHKGIWFTPDYLLGEHYRVVVGEHKWTWLSSARCTEDRLPNPDGIWKWPIQLMFGCFGFGTVYGHIEAMFCVGNYKEYGYYGEPKPEGKHVDIEFTEREIKQNFSMILTNARAEEML